MPFYNNAQQIHSDILGAHSIICLILNKNNAKLYAEASSNMQKGHVVEKTMLRMGYVQI